MVGGAADVGNDAVALDDGDPTGVKTVARVQMSACCMSQCSLLRCETLEASR